jgi:hypothetical protein
MGPVTPAFESIDEPSGKINKPVGPVEDKIIYPFTWTMFSKFD